MFHATVIKIDGDHIVTDCGNVFMHVYPSSAADVVPLLKAGDVIPVYKYASQLWCALPFYAVCQ